MTRPDPTEQRTQVYGVAIAGAWAILLILACMLLSSGLAGFLDWIAQFRVAP